MRVRRRAKPRLLAAGIFAATLALPGPVLAQITYSGYTNGCFGAGCIPANVSGYDFVSLVKPNSTLTYVNSQFSGVADPGDFIHLNGAVNGIFQQEVNNLGAFYLNLGGTNADTYSDVFTLAVRWVEPGSHLSLFTAVLTGTIQVGQAAPNRVEITFGPSREAFRFVDHVTGLEGTVDLAMTDRMIVIAGGLNQTSSARIIGEATITVVPEPMTMILVGSGLVGVAGAARRRRRATEDDSSSI